jgi:phosphoribosylamine--glycine ligase
MKILIVGNGGREHALAWKLAQSPRAEKIYVAPGNAGCAEVAECVDLNLNNLQSVVRWARDNNIDLVVPGPEAVLCDGLVDLCRDSNIKVFGPAKNAAELERSKVFAKNLMRHHGIPTADYAVFEQFEAAENYLASREDGPLVVKADGLAAGKGVMVCKNHAEALEALKLCMIDEAFGQAGTKVVVEEMLVGEEVSVLAITDGKTIAPLASAQDHKPVFDDDQGPNTGGMGAYSPAPLMTDKLLDTVIEKILVPTVHAMNSEGRRFRGILYAGLMITGGGPRVLEYNVRFGDPETQPILARLDTDLVDLLEATADGKLSEIDLKWKDEAAVCVVMASGGYPGKYEKGKEITGLEKASARKGVTVFHAGTVPKKDKVLTAGGRVLGVTALGKDIPTAIESAYAAVKDIEFEGAHYRTDIGQKALKRLKK